MINSLPELKSFYALNQLDIAIKPTYTWCQEDGASNFICLMESFIMEKFGRGRLYEGMLFFSLRGRVICSLTVYSDLKENLPVVSFIYSWRVMPTHNNTVLNFDCFFRSFFRQKTL